MLSADDLFAVALWRGCHCTSVSAWGQFWSPMPRPRLLLPRQPGEGRVGFPYRVELWWSRTGKESSGGRKQGVV